MSICFNPATIVTKFDRVETIASLLDFLPIEKKINEVLCSVRENDISIITGPTGCGKSTGVPLALCLSGYQVVCTEPRRLAASALCDRVSELLGIESGSLVGVRTATEKIYSETETKLTYCTDGYYLTSFLKKQKLPSDVLIIDEIHEWNKNVELILSLWKEQRLRGEPVPKLCIMSATLDRKRLCDSMPSEISVGEIEVEGRTHEISETWLPSGDLVTELRKWLWRGREVLVFLPGKSEIYQLKDELEHSDVNAEVIPLHRELSREEQHRCFHKYGRPKVILATNIAESSITPDVDVVISLGKKRQRNIWDGIEHLEITDCSQFNLTQQKGRCGRLKKGHFILMSDKAFDERVREDRAEIQRTRLELDVLRLLDYGLDVSSIPFVNVPPRHLVESAIHNLEVHGCIRKKGKRLQITHAGHECAFLPAQFELGLLIVEAQKRGIKDIAMLCAAVIEAGGMDLKLRNGYLNVGDWREICVNENRMDPLAHVKLFLEAHRIKKETKNYPEFRDAMIQKGLDPLAYSRALESLDMLSREVQFEIPEEVPNGDTKGLLRQSFIKAFKAHAYQALQDDTLLSVFDGHRERSNRSNVSFFGVANPIVFGYPLTIEGANGKSHEVVHMLVVASKKEVISIVPDIQLPDPSSQKKQNNQRPNKDGSLEGREPGTRRHREYNGSGHGYWNHNGRSGSAHR
ncbi:MAG: ATP-dependent RNA helicase [SAR324 cluster bacterium]|uniref:ATP-dependent RNA helicase n=1 Tax=SAR324 cluster bacterium TaxID=2024889 RepID=A0A7X9FPK7_9DELT|nr:ATP-dependent RNA helicase [SAR324 cluster bacterium]